MDSFEQSVVDTISSPLQTTLGELSKDKTIENLLMKHNTGIDSIVEMLGAYGVVKVSYSDKGWFFSMVFNVQMVRLFKEPGYTVSGSDGKGYSSSREAVIQGVAKFLSVLTNIKR